MSRIKLSFVFAVLAIVVLTSCSELQLVQNYIYPSDTSHTVESVAEVMNESEVTVNTKEVAKESESTHSIVEKSEKENNDLVNVIYLESIPAYITIPDAYDVFLKDNSDNQEALNRRNQTQDKIDLYMTTANRELWAVHKNDSLIAPSHEINIRVKDGYEDIDNLHNLSNAEQSIITATLVAGFAVDDYELIEVGNILFCVFDWENTLNLQQRYSTIVNGKMVYIFLETASDELTTDDRELLLEIVSTFEVST